MLVLDSILSLVPNSGGLWAYGPAPGVELIPYFLGLAAWMGMAFLAVLWAPFSALLRRLRGNKKTKIEVNVAVHQTANAGANNALNQAEPKVEEPVDRAEPRP